MLLSSLYTPSTYINDYLYNISLYEFLINFIQSEQAMIAVEVMRDLHVCDDCVVGSGSFEGACYCLVFEKRKCAIVSSLV